MARRTKAAVAGVPLVVAGQPTTAADPSQRPLDDPSLREHPEAGPVTAANDLTLPDAGPGDNRFHCATLIARIGDDARSRESSVGLPAAASSPRPGPEQGLGER
jgi:hypothetical protein